MATTPANEQAVVAAQAPSGTALLVNVGALAPESLDATLANLARAFPDHSIIVATTNAAMPAPPADGRLQFISYTSTAPAPYNWLLSAADFLNTWKLAAEHHASACLLLGPEAQSLQPNALHALVEAVLTQHADLAMPRYDLGPRDGLVNSAILYPVTRALFASRSRYPLAIDLAFSSRLAERLATVAQRHTAAGGNTALLWPVAEAATASFSIMETHAGPRAIPHPGAADLNTVLAQVAGSLFAEVDARAAFWQRARLAYSPRNSAPPAQSTSQPVAAGESSEHPDVNPMLESFRLAYANLHEIWSLVLPPNSLLGLKKLTLMAPDAFRMPDALWARIVYDFTLAWRLRTLNRGHLLGALTPLYLAWAASHLLQTTPGAPDYLPPEKHVETVAIAFESDKPYLVSRWRWPDRFNP